MTLLKRLRLVTALLGAAGASAAIATSLFGDVRGGPGVPAVTSEVRPDGNKVIDELAVTKFSTLPAITYQVRSGETLFAWQIKPALDAAPARPRDILVMVDTSASQAGKPLQQARNIIQGLAGQLSADDRISVWTVSTPAATRALTKDFQSPESDDVKTAAIALTEVEYGSGATDLKGGLAKALATLAPNRGRHQLVLFLGDGESTFDPISENDRLAIGADMDTKNVFFFAVPLGIKVNPGNLHGLATLTGGAVVRVQEDLANPTKRGEFLTRLKTVIETPVLKSDKVKFGDEVAEVFPTKLPPLRADKPTLVMGKLAKPSPKVSATISGKASGGKSVALALSQDLPASQADHFFLNMMVEQWRDAPHKDAPAMLQADRALALASTQVKLYRDEFLTQANWAITMDRLDEAAKLFAAAKKIDPNDGEANAGVILVEKMKTGRLTKAELEKKISAAKEGLKIDTRGATRQVIQEIAKQEPKQDPKAEPAPGGAQPPAAIDRIREAEALRRVEEQRYRVLVDSTIRRSRQELRTDPDQAYLDLKRQRDEILAYGGIGEDARTRLAADITAVMDEIFRKGAEIKRQSAAEREQIAKTRQKLNEFDRQQADEDRTKARIDSFKQLMQQARYELAYQEAQILIHERIAKGQGVPPTAVATYVIGQQATQLREWRELVRIREDRFLLTMMQAEKSHIPYPDEPPVHFPPAAVWRELTGQRKERYENSILGPEPSPTQKKLQSVLENQRVSYEKDLQTTPFKEVLEDLAKRYDITFVVNKTAIGDMANQLDTAKAEKLSVTKLDGMPIGNFLDVYLRALPVPYITYVVRPDYIEITNYDARLEEKVTRVFPVADLVIPIPQAVNQASLYQNLGIQQQTLAIYGLSSIYGGNLNNFIGGGGNQQQQGIGNPNGGQGNQNNPFFGGAAGGNQGGIVGLGGGGGGGNVGQFGNLGGQFGLQGGTQERLLIQLILETVAKGEWEQSPQNPPQNPNDPPPEPILPVQQRHSIGYYPPARALVVRGSSRYMGAGTMKLKKAEGGQANALPNKPDNGVLVIGPNTPKAPAVNPANPKNPVAVKNPPKKPVEQDPLVITGKKPTLNDPKIDEVALMKKLSKNPKQMWSQAIDWTVTDPGLIVAVADFLMDFDEFGHAAEVLKGNLRKGLATDEWAHEALAVALQMSKADAAEVERAALSAIDLDPTDPKAYLKAAKTESDLKNFDLAVRFCQKAAEYGPDQPGPYANALAYAKDAQHISPDTIEWAASNLLHRDWPMADGIDYHAKTRALLPSFVNKFQAAGVKADGVRKALLEQTQRDVVVELLWQGPADLDLTVVEPSGSTCSATMKRTAGGGVLKGDYIAQADDSRSEIYTAASAFSGAYKVSVKCALGRPLGNKATIQVTKFKGTPKESFELFSVDLSRPQTVEFKVDGGSRTELASVTEDVTEMRLDPTPPSLPATSATTRGMSGGVGAAGSALTAPVAGNSAASLPNVVAPQEKVLHGMGSAADIRASYKLNADRQTYSVHVNPVFATGGKDVKLPKVPLLPGSDN